MLATTIFVLMLLSGTAAPADGTEFSAHPAEPRWERKAVPPRLRTARARKYRTVLREAAAMPANFNGHFRVVQWGCGTNCVEWALADLANGRVWMAPEPLVSCAGGGSRQPGEPAEWFEAYVDSSLLYVHSCTGDRGRVFDTRQVYRYARGRLTLLRTERIGTAAHSPEP